MPTYKEVTATVSTPIVDGNRILGWNGTDGAETVTRNVPKLHIGEVTGDKIFKPGNNGPYVYFGNFVLRLYVTRVYTGEIRLKIYNADNTLHRNLLAFSTNQNSKTQEVKSIFQLQKDQYAEVEYSIRAANPLSTASLTFSIYVDDRNGVAEPPPPIPDPDPIYVTRTKTLSATLIQGANAIAYNERRFDYLELANDANQQVVDSNYPGNHINLWDYFIWKNGRTPNAGESIHFVIPENKTYVAPLGFTSALATDTGPQYQDNQFMKKFVYENERVFTGHAAISLKGWNASLNNNITVELRGKAFGSIAFDQGSGGAVGGGFKLMQLYDKNNKSTPLSYMHLYNTGLFSDPLAHLRAVRQVGQNLSVKRTDAFSTWITLTEPVKQPAFYSEIPCKLIVAQGAYLMGGGGDAHFQIYQKSQVRYNGFMNPFQHEDPSDRINIHGGDAIWIGGANTVVQLENYGYVSGGGGGGATIGSFNYGITSMNFTLAEGGGGAPFGGLVYNNKYPLYVNLVELSKVPLSPKPTFDFTVDFEIDENGKQATADHAVYLNKSEIIKIFDLNQVGYDDNNDTIPDLTELNASYNSHRLLSPIAGYQAVVEGPNGMNLISGGGGAPGQNGQYGTIVHDGGSGGDLADIGNYRGNKGSAVVYKGSNNSLVVNNYAGSVYKA